MDILLKAIIAIPTAVAVGALAADVLTTLWLDTVQAALKVSGV